MLGARPARFRPPFAEHCTFAMAAVVFLAAASRASSMPTTSCIGATVAPLGWIIWCCYVGITIACCIRKCFPAVVLVDVTPNNRAAGDRSTSSRLMSNNIKTAENRCTAYIVFTDATGQNIQRALYPQFGSSQIKPSQSKTVDAGAGNSLEFELEIE